MKEQLIFAFSINPETKEAVFSGNITLPVALQILQDMVISDAILRATKAAKEAAKKGKKGGKK